MFHSHAHATQFPCTADGTGNTMTSIQLTDIIFLADQMKFVFENESLRDKETLQTTIASYPRGSAI